MISETYLSLITRVQNGILEYDERKWSVSAVSFDRRHSTSKSQTRFTEMEKGRSVAFRGRRELAAFRPFLFVSPLANEPINTQRFEAGVWLARTRLNNRKGIAKDFCSDVPIIIEALSADNEHPCSVNINWTRATPFNVPLYTRW